MITRIAFGVTLGSLSGLVCSYTVGVGLAKGVIACIVAGTLGSVIGGLRG